jgi:lysine 6-dehydrogenase
VGDRYVVLGAGRQGTAAAYDLARYASADRVVIADLDSDLAGRSAARVNELAGTSLIEARTVDVASHAALVDLLRGAAAAISAVPYRFNLQVTRAAIEAGSSLCDLGGHTGIAQQQLALDEAARAAGVSVIPDCGLMPGMGSTLAVYAMAQMAQPEHVRIYVGGLPQSPRPPFDYLLTFHIAGLSNEYAGEAVYLRNGEIAMVPVFTELETLQFPEPVGTCEAFVTSGGTSTCPWTFQGTLLTYEEKTVRYPGHCAAFKAFADLGLLDLEPIQVGEQSVVPREAFHALLAPKIVYPEDKDLVVLRVLCSGRDDRGRDVEARLQIVDFQDEATGFRSMERMTGFPAAIVAQMMASGETPRGAVPLEKSVDGAAFVEEWRRRELPLEIAIDRPAPA